MTLVDIYAPSLEGLHTKVSETHAKRDDIQSDYRDAHPRTQEGRKDMAMRFAEASAAVHDALEELRKAVVKLARKELGLK